MFLQRAVLNRIIIMGIEHHGAIDPRVVVKRLARWLNRGGPGRQGADYFIENAGGKITSSPDPKNHVRIFVFGRGCNSATLWDVNGHYISGEQASRVLIKAFQNPQPALAEQADNV